jgi:hypothetical protein
MLVLIHQRLDSPMPACLPPRTPSHLTPPGHWLRSAPMVALALVFCCAPAVNAKGGKPTICCRTSGGTRGTCLNVWAHLVPPSNRFNPGSSRTLALLQGPSSMPTAMTVQLLSSAGELVAGQTLPAQRVGITLITLAKSDWPAKNPAVIWESFPSCQPHKPPTRTSLVADINQEQSVSQKLVGDLGRLCGGMVDTRPLLAAFNLEDYGEKLPEKLPVWCERFKGSIGG